MHKSFPEAALRTSLTRAGSPSRLSSSVTRRWQKQTAESSASPLRSVMTRSPLRRTPSAAALGIPSACNWDSSGLLASASSKRSVPGDSSGLYCGSRR